MSGIAHAELAARVVGRPPMVLRWPGPVGLADWARARADTAAAALIEAMASIRARLGADGLPAPPARAIVVGTQAGAGLETRRFAREITAVGGRLVNPALFPPTVMNAPAGAAAIHHECRGPNVTLCNGATAALDALAFGADLVTSRRAALVFAGGFELDPDPRENDDGRGVLAVVAALVPDAPSPAAWLVGGARHGHAEDDGHHAWRCALDAALAAGRELVGARPVLDRLTAPAADLRDALAALEDVLARARAETVDVLVPLAALSRGGRRGTALVLANAARR